MDERLNDKQSAIKKLIDRYAEQLATEVDAVRASEMFRKYLDFLSRFHKYSALNVMSILTHCPHATHVAGYSAWRMMGRQVKRGEKGIPILIPVFPPKDKTQDDETRDDEGKDARRPVWYKVGHVFDISQTDGDPLPTPPDWKSPAKNAELHGKLLAFAEREGIKVVVQELEGECQGMSMGGTIVLSPQAGTKTFIHELAHELLHQHGGVGDGKVIESEAEAVAYVVARHFGVEKLNCANYIALSGASGKQVRESLETIAACAKRIIAAVEGRAEEEVE